MKNHYSRMLSELKKNWLFYSSNTELFAIWTILFAITGTLFIYMVQANNPFISLILALLIISASTLVGYFTILYLHKIKHASNEHLLSKSHNLLNKSFKLGF